MSTLLRVIGAGWALLGLGNMCGMPWTEGSNTLLSFGLMFNMMLFVLPGLALFGIGQGIARRRAATTAAAPSQATSVPPLGSVQERLQQLKRLLDDNLISADEFEQRRREILKDV